MTRFITIFRDPGLGEWDHHVSYCQRDAEEAVANLIKRGVTLYSTAPLGDTMVELSDHTHQNGEDKASDATHPEGTNPALHLASIFRTMLGDDGHASLSQSAKAGIEFRQLVEQYYREGRLVYVSDDNIVVSKDNIKSMREMSDRHYALARENHDQAEAIARQLREAETKLANARSFALGEFIGGTPGPQASSDTLTGFKHGWKAATRLIEDILEDV